VNLTPPAATLLWFRQDLRLQDNPALAAAVARGAPIIPVYILDDAAEKRWAPGAASRWWLHHSLASLQRDLRARGLKLIFAVGESHGVLTKLAAATKAGALYWNRRYEPAIMARDTTVKAQGRSVGLEVKSFNSALLHEPATIANKQGRPFQVFTPYWRHCLSLPVEPPLKLDAGPLLAPTAWPTSLELADLELLPKISWDGGLREAWEVGEEAALRRLKHFVKSTMASYVESRNLPGIAGTSRLSPSLHFGEISPRQVWAAVKASSAQAGIFPPNNGARVFLSEVGWREFAYHLLYHFPHTPELPLREEFGGFPWAEDVRGETLRAWQRGRTGYPIVDAGMRELWHTGWMHNRVRMIVGSFLVKHLLLPWPQGAAWFWDTLVDSDLASNTLGWQWVAGSGADASPYFRIFAPVLQGRKFDAKGDYVRRWVPELAKLSNEDLHAPWEAAPAALAQAGVRLGQDYPNPIVDHATARAGALAAYQQMRTRPARPA
jgi:deoxyribodipyrimidine photo-lyase